MLSLFTRRVALSAHRSTTTYTRILPSSASTLRLRSISGAGLHTTTLRTFTNPHRNASTKATATAPKPKFPTKSPTNSSTKSPTKSSTKSQTKSSTKSSAKSTTTGRTRSRLTPEQKAAQKQKLQEKKELDNKKKAERAAALRAKLKAKRGAEAGKKREAAARNRKLLAEKKKKLAEANKAKAEREKERQKAREAKKPKIIEPPPRRMTAFSVYIQEAKKPFHEASTGWSGLSQEAKQEYTARAKAIAEKRKEEFDAFLKTVSPLDILRYNRHQRSKGANRILVKFHDRDRPLTSFMRYSQVFRSRPDQAGKRLPDISKAAGAAWRSLTQEEKDQYKHKLVESTTAQEDSQSL